MRAVANRFFFYRFLVYFSPFLLEINTDDLPEVKIHPQKYESKEQYLDTNFRLMREECFYKLKKGICDFVNKERVDPRDMMMYRYNTVVF